MWWAPPPSRGSPRSAWRSAQSRYAGTLDQHPAIDYRGGALSDDVTALARDIKDGKTTLAFDGRQGFLRSLLERLNVPVESQMLLFSKTGIQNAHTSPETPRALYFNDRVIVGYIPGAPVLEIASHDPRQGVIFQTLKQDSWLPGRVRAARSVPELPFVRQQPRRAGHPGAQHVRGRRRPRDAAVGQLRDRSSLAARAAMGRVVRDRHARRRAAHGQCVCGR